jgi:hypothetical protein
MNTTRTKHQRTRGPAAESRYTQYWAVRIRKRNSREWCVFVARGVEDAIKKAEHREGCLEVLEAHDIKRHEYLIALDRLKRGVVK